MFNQKLLTAAVMAMTMAEIFPEPRGKYGREGNGPTPTPPAREPTAADTEALARAEAKRQRKRQRASGVR